MLLSNIDFIIALCCTKVNFILLFCLKHVYEEEYRIAYHFDKVQIVFSFITTLEGEAWRVCSPLRREMSEGVG